MMMTTTTKTTKTTTTATLVMTMLHPLHEISIELKPLIVSDWIQAYVIYAITAKANMTISASVPWEKYVH